MESKPKKDLIRIVYTSEGDLIEDISGKAQGRGVYLCKDQACIEKAKKRGALQRGLKRKISEDQVEDLLAQMERQYERKDT